VTTPDSRPTLHVEQSTMVPSVWSESHISLSEMKAEGIDTGLVHYRPETRPPDPMIYPVWEIDLSETDGLIIRGTSVGWNITAYTAISPGGWRNGQVIATHEITNRITLMVYVAERMRLTRLINDM
jgi:hypothetical protein